VLSATLASSNAKFTIRRLLIANRGEIACRIIHTAQAMGIECVAVFSETDREARHVQMADQALCIGPAPASESYLNIAAIIAACKQSSADTVHPGYGFLSENADFAQACFDAGLCFVGPTPAAMRALGNKASAKEIAQSAGVAVARGYTGSVSDPVTVEQEAAKIGYPLMVKAAAGGGGRGMRLVHQEQDLMAAIVSAQREAKSSFGSDQVFLERAILNARHIEIQILADQRGNIYSLGERDCSTQRKNQKIIEEAPAPGLSAEARQALSNAAIQLCKASGYYGAATVEFLVEQLDSTSAFCFLEVNTRLQVEHPVTEALLGINLVKLQLQVAQGEQLLLNQKAINTQMANAGHAIELRLCAEDPTEQFAPQVGHFRQATLKPQSLNFVDQNVAIANLTQFAPHDNATGYVRIDSGLNSSGTISPWYDSMCAKLISYAPTRDLSIQQMLQALGSFALTGLQSNQAYLANLLNRNEFRNAQLHTRWLDTLNESLLPANTDDELSSAQHSLLLKAAAVFAHRQSKQHGLLQGFGALNSTLYIELNEIVYSIKTRCVANSIFECKKLIDKDQAQAISSRSQSEIPATGAQTLNAQMIDVQTLNPTWFGQDVWLPNSQNPQLPTLQPVGGLFKLLAYRAKNNLHNLQDAGDVFSTMHGKVSQVFVGVGDAVKKGDVLLTIEAMKMEHQIVAKVDGVVTQLAITLGQQLCPSQLLITLSNTP
jgi:acetyl/propionyl-CoA carboxylase alpha subunit